MSLSDRGAHGRELARVLRTGSFAEALDAAIAARGLTLDRLRHHLVEQGVDVSTATLSYWRHNRRRPEREGSLRAVRALEGMLGLPETSLLTLLGPPKPRGRWLTRPSETGDSVTTQFDDPSEGTYRLIGVHDVFTVGEDLAEKGVRSRLLVRGERGRVTRCLVKYKADTPEFPPELTDVRFCRTGRALAHSESGLLVVELLLDRPLDVGEHAVVEYEFSSKPGPPVEMYYRQFLDPIASYSQQVQFEGRTPAHCHSYRQTSLADPERPADPLPVGHSGSTCQVAVNLRPGVVGTRWQW